MKKFYLLSLILCTLLAQGNQADNWTGEDQLEIGLHNWNIIRSLSSTKGEVYKDLNFPVCKSNNKVCKTWLKFISSESQKRYLYSLGIDCKKPAIKTSAFYEYSKEEKLLRVVKQSNYWRKIPVNPTFLRKVVEMNCKKPEPLEGEC